MGILLRMQEAFMYPSSVQEIEWQQCKEDPLKVWVRKFKQGQGCSILQLSKRFSVSESIRTDRENTDIPWNSLLTSTWYDFL